LRARAELKPARVPHEIVIVDDGSDESLAPIVARFREQVNIRLIRQEKAGPAAARNCGASASQGRYVAFTDDDCEPEANWLRMLDEAVSKHPSCAVGGSTVNGLSGNLFSSANQMLLQFLYDYWNFADTDACFLASSNIAFSREQLMATAGFDASFLRAAGEDLELCNRREQNRIVYVPDAQVRHFHALTFSSFFRQHFEYGRGASRFWQVKRVQEG
jgi:glycosyltransferase involved in cell wall biosynthesis